MVDGSIKIPVELDDKQAQKELNRLTTNILKARDTIARKNIKKDGITAQLEEATRKASALQAKLDEINAAKERAGARRSKLSDDITEAQAASDNAKNWVERLNTEIETARDNAKRAARELGLMGETAAKDPNAQRSATGRAAILDARSGLEAQRQKVAELNAEYERLVAEQEQQRQVTQMATAETARLRAELAAVPSDESFAAPIKETEAALKEATAEVKKRKNEEAAVTWQIQEEEANLKRLTSEYEQVNAQLRKKGVEAWGAQAKEAVGGISEGFRKGFKTMLRYGLGIRSMFVLFRRLRSILIEGIKDFARYDTETGANIKNLKSSLATLKGSFVSAFAPIVNAVVPWLVTLVNWLSNAIAGISQFIAILGGKSTYKKAIANIEDVGEATTDAADAAEEAQKNYSGLDEMNIFQEDRGGSTSGGGGGGGGGGAGSGISYVDEAVDTGGTLANIADFVKANLESVRLLLDEFGFIIGVILLAAGHPALGIAMMLFFGYQGIKEVVTNWDSIKTQLQGSMGALFTIVGGALLTIGLILALTGHIGIGIALMAIGAADIAMAVAANWGELKEKMGGPVGVIMTIAGGAALAIGLVLALTGHLAIGIPLMVVGAATLATEMTANWGKLKEAMEGPVGKIVAIASGAALAIGLILALNGRIGIGLGLMIVGAAGLATAITANWGSLKEAMEGPVGKVVAVASGAALAVGLVLTLTGNFVVGIPLMALGAAGLVTAAVANWDSLKQKIQPALDVLEGLWGAAKVAIGLVLALSGVGMGLGIKLIKSGVEDIEGAAATPTWSGLKSKISGVLDDIKNAYDTWAEKHPVIAGILSNIWGTAKEALLKIKVAFGTGDEETETGDGTLVDTANEKIDEFGGKVDETIYNSGFAKWFRETFGIEGNPELEVDVKGNFVGTTTSDELKKNPPYIDANGNIVEGTDGIPQTKRPGIGATGIISSAESSLAKKPSIDSTGNLTATTKASGLAKPSIDSTGKLTSTTTKGLGTPSIDSEANFNSRKNNLTVGQRTFYSHANFKDSKNNLAEKDRTFKSWASFKESKNNLTESSRTFWSWANFKSYYNNLGTPSLGASASLNEYKRNWDNWPWVPISANIVTIGGQPYLSRAVGGVYSGGSWHDIARYAGGGLPMGSQLFWARERGPELVGTLGGHTAVMNNDQIVASVSAGVARAISNIRFVMTGGYDKALGTLAAIADAARASIEEMRTSVEHIAYVMSSPNLALAGPAVATGTVIPPMLINLSDDLQGIKDAVDRLTARIDSMNTDRGDINVSAQVRERVLFDMTIQQGRAYKQQTGRNPFDI